MRHLRFLHYFDAVARAGSIRKAAEQLNVTSSAVNRRIMDLEQELETPLFERRPRGVRLTAAGELFVHYVREQTSDLDRVRSQIEDLKGLRRGTVRIAASQALALEFLPREIAAYRARFPFVHFDVRVLDHIRAMTSLAEYEVDLVLVFRPPYLRQFPAADVVRTAAGRDDAGQDHPLAGQTHRPAARLCALSGGAAEPEIGGRQLLDEALARQQPALRHRRAVELVRVSAPSGDARQCDLVPDRIGALRRRTSAASSPATSTSATRRAPISCSDN